MRVSDSHKKMEIMKQAVC